MKAKQVNPETHFIINGKELKLNEDYFPFVYSPDVNIEALPAIALQESGLPWFINLKDVIDENADQSSF